MKKQPTIEIDRITIEGLGLCASAIEKGKALEISPWENTWAASLKQLTIELGRIYFNKHGSTIHMEGL